MIGPRSLPVSFGCWVATRRNSAPTPTLSPSPVGALAGHGDTHARGGGTGNRSTPSTGAGGGWLALGAALVIAGVGMLIVGKRRHSIDI